jgi:predicted nucleic acid-binding protein
LYEFYAVVTHPKIFPKPTPPTTAWEACQEFSSSPQVRLLTETEDFAEKFGGLIGALDLKGPKIHDARVAVLCHVHGVRELWSSDRDFSRFKFLKVLNPLVGER